MISTSLEQTNQIAKEFAVTLKGGDVIFLEGDLGAGKTTFVQGVLEALAYTEPVRSPTFSIMNTYKLFPAQDRSFDKIVHMDFYRFESSNEVQSLGLDEMMEDKRAVFFIEWPEKGIATNSQMSYTYCIKFNSLTDGKREVTILAYGSS